MEGIVRVTDGPAGDPGPLFGILYAEDFDEVPAPLKADAAEPAPASPERAITPADVEEACARAVEAAREGWERDEARSKQEALGVIAAALNDAARAAEAVALDAAGGVAQTMLACVAGVLPELCGEHGPAEVKALLTRLLPLLRAEPRVVVRVHADLVRSLQNEFEGGDAHGEQVISIRAAPLARGDVKVSWESGALVRDGRQIVQAIQDALAQLGLTAAQEQPAKRRLVHAD